MDNLDIWAIESDPDELYTAIDTLKTGGDIIVYSNLICDFSIGDEIIKSRQFDTIVYSEANNFLALFMRGGKGTKDAICNYLDKKDLRYTEITFIPSIDDYSDDPSFLDVWPVRENDVLQDALEDTVNRGVDLKCDYFPNLSSSLDLSYLTNSTNDKYPIEGMFFQGVIALNDKIILLVSQGEERSVSPEDVIELTTKLGIKCDIYNNEEFALNRLYQKKKTLK